MNTENEMFRLIFNWRSENRDQAVELNEILEPYIDCLGRVCSTPHELPPLKCPRNVSCEKKTKNALEGNSKS